MSYEVPLPSPDELQRKPIRNAVELHRHLESKGFKPLAVVVDNASARVRVYFEDELSEGDKKRLFESVLEFYRKHIGAEK
jgi:hypothetical protein